MRQGAVAGTHHVPDGREAATALRCLSARLENPGDTAGTFINGAAHGFAVDRIADADIHGQMNPCLGARQPDPLRNDVKVLQIIRIRQMILRTGISFMLVASLISISII